MNANRIGIDIGGTNSDAVLVDGAGKLIAWAKTATTSPVEAGVRHAMNRLIAAHGEPLPNLCRVVVGTTHATNALLQRRDLHRVGLIRLAGHRPESLPPAYCWPEKLRATCLAHTVTISGGFECHGSPITPLNLEEARDAIEILLQNGAESIAIVGVFSPINDEQERQVAALVPSDVPVTLSSEIGGIGFIERENSAILNAALIGSLRHGFGQLEATFRSMGIEAPVYITQNNGSILPVDAALRHPILTLSAGPTNSFVGATKLAGLNDALVVDIGGTSTDIGIVLGGFCRRSLGNAEVGGVALNASMPDVLSLAIGGGSHVQEDGVGPQSVGPRLIHSAVAFGGDQLTLTDLSLRLGHITIPGAQPERVELSTHEAERLVAHTVERIDHAVRRMAGKHRDLPIVLVGGGAQLFAVEQMGSRYLKLNHGPVANAYGAALAEVAATTDTVVSLMDREQALDRIQREARARAIRKGACPKQVRLADLQIIPYHYVPNQMARVIATASGPWA